ncbi:uncharacterized protein LOC143257025 isoform X2 [Tachypleus tridentatus]|uniref:uncharacterized protein LOC143257025 isoform X2 n=1 Tax=Tachypleus tridentatus TaxID=6853 RepID=UPI003FD4A63C
MLIDENPYEAIRGLWESAYVSQFLRLFQGKFGFTKITTWDLEAALVDGASIVLRDVCARLLRFLTERKDILIKNFEDSLRNLLCQSKVGPVQFRNSDTGSWLKLSAEERLTILMWLVDHVYQEKNEELAEYLQDNYDADELRGICAGHDAFNNSYWYLGDLRLYREKKTSRKEWECVCVTLAEWQTFLRQFRKTTNPQERDLYIYLHYQLFPLIRTEINDLQAKEKITEAQYQDILERELAEIKKDLKVWEKTRKAGQEVLEIEAAAEAKKYIEYQENLQGDLEKVPEDLLTSETKTITGYQKVLENAEKDLKSIKKTELNHQEILKCETKDVGNMLEKNVGCHSDSSALAIVDGLECHKDVNGIVKSLQNGIKSDFEDFLPETNVHKIESDLKLNDCDSNSLISATTTLDFQSTNMTSSSTSILCNNKSGCDTVSGATDTTLCPSTVSDSCSDTVRETSASKPESIVPSCSNPGSTTPSHENSQDSNLPAIPDNRSDVSGSSNKENAPPAPSGNSLQDVSHVSGTSSMVDLTISAPQSSTSIQSLSNNMLSKSSDGLETQYLQQQSHIFVFSTNRANKAADAVLSGQFPSMIAFHCSQPGTKRFLEMHPVKTQQFYRQNPATWLNTLAQMKQSRQNKIGYTDKIVRTSSFVSHFSSESVPCSGSCLSHNHNLCSSSCTPQGNNSCLQPGSCPRNGPCDVHGSGTCLGSSRESVWGSQCRSTDVWQGTQWGRSQCDCDLPTQQFQNPLMRPGIPCYKTGGSHPGCCMPHQHTINPSSIAMNSDEPSLVGVKIPNENLTPQQRQHREEQLATIRKMQQLLFPDQTQYQSLAPPGGTMSVGQNGFRLPERLSSSTDAPCLPRGCGMRDHPCTHPTSDRAMVSLSSSVRPSFLSHQNVPFGPQTAQADFHPHHYPCEDQKKPQQGGHFVLQQGVTNSNSDQHMNLSHLQGSRGSLPPSSSSTRFTSPVDPSCQHTYSTMPGPNFSHPSPRCGTLLNSITTTTTSSSVTPPNGSLAAMSNLINLNCNPTSIPSSTISIPNTINAPGLGSSGKRRMSSTGKQTQQLLQDTTTTRTLTNDTLISPPSKTMSLNSGSGGTFPSPSGPLTHTPPITSNHCKMASSLSNMLVKEPNLMPVPSPQQIAFEGQELTIQKQPNINLGDPSTVSPSGLPPGNTDVSYMPSIGPPVGSGCTSTACSGPHTHSSQNGGLSNNGGFHDSRLIPQNLPRFSGPQESSLEQMARLAGIASADKFVGQVAPPLGMTTSVNNMSVLQKFPTAGTKNRFSVPSGNSEARFGAPTVNPEARFGAPTVNPEARFGAPTVNPEARFGAPTVNPEARFGAPTVNPEARFGAPTVNSEARFGARTVNPEARFGAPTVNPEARFGAPTANPEARFGAPTANPEIRFGAPTANPEIRFTAPTSNPEARFGVPTVSPAARFGVPTAPLGTPTIDTGVRFGMRTCGNTGARSGTRFEAIFTDTKGKLELQTVDPEPRFGEGVQTLPNFPAESPIQLLDSQLYNHPDMSIPAGSTHLQSLQKMTLPFDSPPTSKPSLVSASNAPGRNNDLPIQPASQPLASHRLTHFEPSPSNHCDSTRSVDSQMLANMNTSSMKTSSLSGNANQGQKVNFNTSMQGLHQTVDQHTGSQQHLQSPQMAHSMGVCPQTINNTYVNATMAIQQVNIQNITTASMQPNPSVMPGQQTFSSSITTGPPIVHSSASPAPSMFMGSSGPSPHMLHPSTGQRVTCHQTINSSGLHIRPGIIPYLPEMPVQSVNGANVQVKATAPNTIQYLPTRPQIPSTRGSECPPSMEFLHRLATPLTNLESKVPTQNLQYFPGMVPVNDPTQPGPHIRPDMGPVTGMHSIQHVGMANGPMLQRSASDHMPYVEAQLYQGQMVPHAIHCHPQLTRYPGGRAIPGMTVEGGFPDKPYSVSHAGLGSNTCQPLPPSINYSRTTADPGYTVQFHNFQQQSYAAETFGCQMNTHNNVLPTPSFLGPK